MRKPIKPLALLCALALLAAQAAAADATANSAAKLAAGGNPYRLDVASADYRLVGTAESAAKTPGANVSPQLSRMIERESRAQRLDPALVNALIRAESGYRTDAVSPKGAVGLMQIMPETARRFGAHDVSEPQANLRAGTAYLRYLLQKYANVPLALAAYNAGEGAVAKYGNRIPPYAETQNYVREIGKSLPGASAYMPKEYLPGLRMESESLDAYLLRRPPTR